MSELEKTFEWLNKSSSQILHQVLKDLDLVLKICKQKT